MREHGIAQWGRYRKSCISSKLALVGQFWRSTWRNAPRDIIFVFIPIVIGAGGLIKNEGPPAAKAQGLVHYLHMYTEKDHSCVHVWTCFRAGGLDGNLHDGEQAACWSPCLRPRVVFVRGASALLVYGAVKNEPGTTAARKGEATALGEPSAIVSRGDGRASSILCVCSPGPMDPREFVLQCPTGTPIRGMKSHGAVLLNVPCVTFFVRFFICIRSYQGCQGTKRVPYLTDI